MTPVLNARKRLSMYAEHILDHAQEPYHNFELPDYTHDAEDVNPLCGDRIRFTIEVPLVRGDGFIWNIGWEGEGCCLCIAAASMLAQHFDHSSLAAIREFTPNKLRDLLRIRVPKSRRSCVLLPLRVLKLAADSPVVGRKEPELLNFILENVERI
jgi:nitrogen fixation NifU-like protein